MSPSRDGERKALSSSRASQEHFHRGRGVSEGRFHRERSLEVESVSPWTGREDLEEEEAPTPHGLQVKITGGEAGGGGLEQQRF